ncbi:Mobile element protein [Photobacterium marinum]|uniref:Mobile element protein n=1 Tax=Photobacterium marinum TaxID=1056511 RepID=L8J6Q3_9GAMM|nr:IS4 family transposase [Photobacterium marinum]ELR64466.1 Mobile element protein [Photobacterium marinum]
MRDIQILHDPLREQCSSIHKKRLNSLMDSVKALLNNDALTLTLLGRSLPSKAKTKHCIKRVDRLLGNCQLHRERLDIYRWHCHQICSVNPQPIVLVDWADIREYKRLMVLRASVAVDGRSVTLFEQSFTFKQYNSPRSHQIFLDNFKAVLPSHVIPIIVTDAGFRNTWFRQVEAMEWCYLGRVRGDVNTFYNKQWHHIKQLFKKANNKPKYIGLTQLAKRKPLLCHLHLFKKETSRKRKDRPRGREHFTAQAVHRKSAKEPWLLATNIPTDIFSSRCIVRIYEKRMQIEETFRDLKSPQYGFGLRQSRTNDPKRLDVLLLIGLLTFMVYWWFGIAAEHAGWHRHFQANTIKKRRVLSFVRLGKEVFRRMEYHITDSTLRWAQQELIMMARSSYHA